MSSRIIPVLPFDYLVFGATGDLARRKLIPALYHRFRDTQVPEEARIIASSREEMTADEYRGVVRQALDQFVDSQQREPEVVGRFLETIDYVSIDASSDRGWSNLVTILRPDVVRAFYLAVSPQLVGLICEQLGKRGLATPESRVVIEKPIGHSLASAREVNDSIAAVFEESQVFRIDHYLGKETVQNLMALRFANSLYEPLWNNAQIDHVQITVAEDIGVGSRGGYYDQAGALRDMVQNHLLQLLCLVAMEPPESYQADAIRDEKLKVLRALKPMDEERAQKCTVRGQYTALTTDSGRVPAYVDEIEADVSSTETFVALKLEVGNWRWAGVPFYLRTGKRLSQRVSEIVVAFKPIPHSIFPSRSGALHSNKLVIRLQPDEGVMQWIMIKDPGPGGMRLRHVPLDMSFAEQFEIRQPEAYERLLLDVIRGDQTLFMRRDEVEAAWTWIEPILKSWETAGTAPQAYKAGTWGPSKAIALIERDGRTWHEDTVTC